MNISWGVSQNVCDPSRERLDLHLLMPWLVVVHSALWIVAGVIAECMCQESGLAGLPDVERRLLRRFECAFSIALTGASSGVSARAVALFKMGASGSTINVGLQGSLETQADDGNKTYVSNAGPHGSTVMAHRTLPIGPRQSPGTDQAADGW